MYKRQMDQIQRYNSFKSFIFQTLPDILIGLGIGLVASGVLAYWGINFEVDINIVVLIPIAILLMLIGTKWGCFSYVVPISFMIEGLSKLFHYSLFTLDYEMLIYLVGVLHIIEGTLVLLRGYQHAKPFPVYRQNKLTYTKVMNHIWMIPFVVTIIPQFIPIPLYAVLAYGDEARVRTPRKQACLTGGLILVFGVIIFILAHFMRLGWIQTGGVILLMPVLHEMIFVIEGHMNKK
ncbi:MAG: hypothetical protein RR448_00705 [Niameybacter sp.]